MLEKPIGKKSIPIPSTKEAGSISKNMDKGFLIPHNPLLFHPKEYED